VAKPASVGSSAPLGRYGFQGAIARLRLLDQAMTDDEIGQAYRTAGKLVPAVAEKSRTGANRANRVKRFLLSWFPPVPSISGSSPH
jgi:hypothetical protein